MLNKQSPVNKFQKKVGGGVAGRKQARRVSQQPHEDDIASEDCYPQMGAQVVSRNMTPLCNE